MNSVVAPAAPLCLMLPVAELRCGILQPRQESLLQEPCVHDACLHGRSAGDAVAGIEPCAHVVSWKRIATSVTQPLGLATTVLYSRNIHKVRTARHYRRMHASEAECLYAFRFISMCIRIFILFVLVSSFDFITCKFLSYTRI